MRLLVVSEGKNELRSAESRGALTILVERLLGLGCDVETRKVSDPAIILQKGKGTGMSKRCVAWMQFAMKHGFDALVLVIDEDGDRSRLGQINQAQAVTAFPIPRALGLAIRTFDAWMLADEVALSMVLGKPVNRQRDMESIPDPKDVCKTLCDEVFGLSDLYARIADQINLPHLESRCPVGFAPFAQRVRGLIGRNTPE